MRSSPPRPEGRRPLVVGGLDRRASRRTLAPLDSSQNHSIGTVTNGLAAAQLPPRSAGAAARFATLAIGYWAAGALVFGVGTVGSNVALIWPSAGIGLAALLAWGPRFAPAIFLGALAVGLSRGLPITAAVVIALGNSLGPLVAAALLGHLDFRRTFERPRDLVGFLAVGVGLLPIPPALLGPLTLCSVGRISCEAVPGSAVAWWMGDSLGVLIAAPVLLGSVRSWWPWITTNRMVLETVAVLTGAIATAAVVFLSPNPPAGGPSLPLPFALWSAIRLRRLGAGLVVLIIGAAAVAGTASGTGPFPATSGPAPLWPYLTMVALVSVVIATLITEREAAFGRLQSSEQLARSAVEAASEAIFVVDQAGRYTDANEAGVSLLGYSRAELLTRHVGDDVVPDELARVGPALDRLRSGQRTENEWRLRRKDGTEIWAEISASKLPDGRLQGIVRDVTQRRRAEIALRASEARYRAIIDTEPECVKVIGPTGELLEMNPAGLAMIEVDAIAEVRGSPVIDLVVAEYRDQFRALHQRVMAGETGTLLFEIVGRRGSRRWLHTTAAPLRDETGQPTALLGVTRDITLLKQVDDARLIATRRNEALVRALGEVVYDWDLASGRIAWGGRFQEVLGGTATEPETTTANDWAARVHPDDVDGLSRAVAEARGSSRAFERDYRVRRADGRYVSIQDRGVFQSAEGQPDRVIGVLRDVTTTVEARERILRLAAFPELSPAAVIEFDAAGRISYWNRAADTMARQVQLTSVAGLLPADHPRMVRECRDSGEERHRVDNTVDGRTFSASFLPIGALGAVHCYVNDVTDEMRTRAHLEHTQRMDSIGRLAGGVAHDFNNILQVITGFGTLAIDPASRPEEREAHLTQVLRAADRAAQLTRQLLAFSRRQPLRMADTDLNEVARGMLAMVERLIGEHIVVSFVPGSQLANVHADRSQIEQVLLNLCINARDAMPKGGALTIETANVIVDPDNRASFPGAGAGPYIQVSVTDTGAGMDQAVLDRIFEPFFTTKGPDKGTGLGLAVAYGIIEQHGGMIKAASEPGTGTRFDFYLPAADRMARVDGARPAPAPPRGSELLLVAEDDDQVRQLAVETLERAGYRVVAACDGTEAVSLFERHASRIALVLLDLVMPGEGGPEAFRRIRERRADVPVLFASGYGGQGVSPTFATDHGTTLIEKPYQPDRLLREVRAAIDGAPRPS